MPSCEPVNPESQAVFELLLGETTPAPAEEHNRVEAIRDMAAANVINQVGAKIDAQNAKFDAQSAKFEELRRENSTLRWMLGLGFTVLGILIAILALVLR